MNRSNAGFPRSRSLRDCWSMIVHGISWFFYVLRSFSWPWLPAGKLFAGGIAFEFSPEPGLIGYLHLSVNLVQTLCLIEFVALPGACYHVQPKCPSREHMFWKFCLWCLCLCRLSSGAGLMLISRTVGRCTRNSRAVQVPEITMFDITEVRLDGILYGNLWFRWVVLGIVEE